MAQSMTLSPYPGNKMAIEYAFSSLAIESESEYQLKQFTLFSQLPGELRLKIYDHILALAGDTRRILKVSSSPHICRYTANSAPPILLAVSAESRTYALKTYRYLSLGPSILAPAGFTHSKPKRIPLPIPISYPDDILYLSGMSPIFASHINNTVYHLSTSSASRNLIRFLAFDYRVWTQLCDHGLLGCLARMRSLTEVFMVLEFGRSFTGQLGFLQAPDWRSDLMWSAKRAFVELNRARDRARGVVRKQGDDAGEENDMINVRCVILTKGGEQA